MGRRAVVCALLVAAVGLLVPCGLAYAGNNLNSISASATPNLAGKPARLSVHLRTAYLGDAVPDAGYHSVIGIEPATLRLRRFPSCSPAQIAAGPDACSGARVGSGRATEALVPCGTHPPLSALPPSSFQHLSIQLYNGRNSLVALVRGIETPGLSAIIVLSITRSSSSDELRFDLPDALLEPAAGTCSPVVSADLSIDKRVHRVKRRPSGHKRKRARRATEGLLENGPCPIQRKWSFTYATRFTDGSRTPDGRLTRVTVDQATSSTQVPCASPAPSQGGAPIRPRVRHKGKKRRRKRRPGCRTHCRQAGGIGGGFWPGQSQLLTP